MQYVFLGLLLTCLLLVVAAICLGVRCEYGCPPFPTYPKPFSPLLSTLPNSCPFPGQGRVTTTISLAFQLVSSQSILECCVFLIQYLLKL